MSSSQRDFFSIGSRVQSVYSEFLWCARSVALPEAILRDDPRERRVPYPRRGFSVGWEAVRVEAECDVLVSMAEALTDDRERRSVSRIDACEWRSEWSEEFGYPVLRSSALVRVPT